jgi:hypothetical protein
VEVLICLVLAVGAVGACRKALGRESRGLAPLVGGTAKSCFFDSLNKGVLFFLKTKKNLPCMVWAKRMNAAGFNLMKKAGEVVSDDETLTHLMLLKRPRAMC